MFMERESTGNPGSAGSSFERRAVPVPSPWVYEVLPTIDSTNTYAARLPAWSAVRAETQSKGRGRNADRVWVSDRGGLWLSAVLPCPGPRSCWETLPLVAGQAVISAVTALGVPGARLRWPNDVMVGTGKLAGLLVERHTPDTAVVGIGLNVFNDPAGHDPKLSGRTISLGQLWTAGGPPASEFGRRWTAGGPPALDAGSGRPARGPWSVDDVAAMVLEHLRQAHAVLASEGFAPIGRALNDAWGEPRRVEVTLNSEADRLAGAPRSFQTADFRFDARGSDVAGSASETTNAPRVFWFHGVDEQGRLRCTVDSQNPAADAEFLFLTANDVALFRELPPSAVQSFSPSAFSPFYVQGCIQ